MKLFAFVTVFVFSLFLSTVVGDPSLACQICEDVAQTWHDQFRCAGEFLNWGDVHSTDIRGCEGPTFDCNKLIGNLKGNCIGQSKEFAFEPLASKMIWEGMMLEGKPFETCMKLGKCQNYTKADARCFNLFNTKSCGLNPGCPSLLKYCKADCYVCVWLLRDYPLFQENCRPPGVTIGQDVPMPGDILLQVNEKMGTRAHATSTSSSTLELSTKNNIDACWALWNEFKSSMKARYFLSWKRYVNTMSNALDRLLGNMWDANVVCKCLGKCKLTRYEDLGLTQSCEYSDFEQKMMEEAFRNEGEIKVLEEKSAPETKEEMDADAAADAELTT